MKLIAKVAIQSNLPQLDRLFDYSIPEWLIPEVQVGSKVKVIFGRSKKPLEAFVIEISQTTDYKGALSEIVEVVGDVPMLQPGIFDLCSELSDRAACNLGELLGLAVPSHMPRVFNAFKAKEPESPDLFLHRSENSKQTKPTRSFVLAEPRVLRLSEGKSIFPSWVHKFVSLASKNAQSGSSSVLLVPDYRESEVLLRALREAGLGDFLVDYTQVQIKSKQYESFLSALTQRISIVVGSRSAAFAPVNNLGLIAMFDESDPSFVDQSSPYLHTRDVVLVRQSIQQCSLLFASHSISTDMVRLIESGYLFDETTAFANPQVSMSEPGLRIDSHAYQAIKKALTNGSVLVQVASLGDSTAYFCQSCNEAANCNSCHGPLWKDSAGHLRCRWCNSFALDHVCACGSSSFTSGRPGATRTASELGRSFPQARVIESTGDKRITIVSGVKNLVVATAGSEPYAEDGYSAVVVLDANVVLSRQKLRSVEEAVRIWSNAIAKLAVGGSAVLVGVKGEFGNQLVLWNHAAIATKELKSRTELRLPPAVRMGSIIGAKPLIEQASKALGLVESVECIGPAPMADSDQWRLMFKYQYSKALELGKLLKVQLAKISVGKTKVLKSGRTSRALTVKMNDSDSF